MNKSQIESRVAALNVRDLKTVDAFIKQLLDDAREGPRALVDLFLKNPQNMKFLSLLPQCADEAIVPLLEVPVGKPDLGLYGWVLRAVANAEVDFRNSIIQRLLPLLDNKTPIPQPVDPKNEEQPPPCRICDEAYLALRRIMRLDEEARAFELNAYAYLHLSEVEQNVEIMKLKKSKIFTQFMQ